jgi:hypothetical protein
VNYYDPRYSYTTYINSYNKAHILLDQTYAYDQGYNALEAMAKGKVVLRSGTSIHGAL